MVQDIVYLYRYIFFNILNKDSSAVSMEGSVRGVATDWVISVIAWGLNLDPPPQKKTPAD